MGWSSFLKSPKKEEEQVPDGRVKGVDILNDFEGFFELGDEEKSPLDNINMFGAHLDWDFMDSDEFSITERNKKDEDDDEAFGCVPEACFFKEEGFFTKLIKTENIAFEEEEVDDDDDGLEKKVSLNLNLNYQEVLDAWSGRGSLWADKSDSFSKASYGHYMGEVPVMEEERTRREACVLRYKEKRQTRLFSKKIRYQVRKLNADKRPRLKDWFNGTFLSFHFQLHLHKNLKFRREFHLNSKSPEVEVSSDSPMEKAKTGIHVVAMPFPGRGHINPMMNICKLMCLKQTHILITLVVTEEWFGLIGSDPKPDNIRFATIQNVIPSENIRAADYLGFNEAVVTKMEAPFEKLLDRLEQRVDAIIADVELRWPITVGDRRNIPVASLWTMSATFFMMLYRTDISARRRQLPSNWFDHSNEVDQIAGLSSTQKSDLQKVFQENDKRFLKITLDCISRVPKAHYLLFTSFFEFEPEMMETLKLEFPFPVYPIGPAIPYFELDKEFQATNDNDSNYKQWLDSQPADSVLYISLGSFLAVSASQMDEIASGLRNSGVRFLWVARGEAARLKESCGGKGLVVSWCDQLKVLCHSSVGGFWSHCGWNSTLEAVFAGVPLLTFPLFLDQYPNSTHIVEDWNIGWRVKGSKVGTETLIFKEEISELVQRFMDLKCPEGKQMRDGAKKLKEISHKATGEGGSSHRNLDEFIRSISQSETK